MAQVSNEQFLFSCIENSNGGTVNWQKVADECGIVSKGAANIKYTRLKKKFGTVTKDANTPSDDVTPAADVGIETPKKKGPAKNGSAKKRKVSEVDDEERAPVKKEQGDEDEL